MTAAFATPVLGLARPPIMTRAFVLTLVAGFGYSTSFYLLFSAVPRYATSVGASGVGASLTTGAMMLATVAAQLVTPRLLIRYGYRRVFAAGLVLLGVPALMLVGSASMAVVLLVCVLRGLGFAVVVVLGGALVATLAPAQRRAEGLGIFGIVCGIPSIIALPLGLWLAESIGYAPVFAAGALAALVGLVAVKGLPEPEPSHEPIGIIAGLRTGALLRPSIVFAATTMAVGVVVTFLPLTVSGASSGIVATALLAHSAAATLTRAWAGRVGDRHGATRLLAPGLLLSAAGVLVLGLTADPAVVVAGMVVFGVGFGTTQTASMAIMLDRVSPSSYGTVSALWNVAYDAGLGAGAVGFGVVATQTGYSLAFVLMSALMVSALVPMLRSGGRR